MTDNIAFYGTLMNLADDRLEYIKEIKLPGFLYNVGKFPAYKHFEDSRYTVRAEMFQIIDPSILSFLDTYEGYVAERPVESLYLREKITVDGLPVWTYVFNRSIHQYGRIYSGDWLGFSDRLIR